MLIEEKQRNLQMQQSCNAEINKLPKGSISIKKSGKNDYCYLKYRKNDKFISVYVGRCDKKLTEIKNQVEKRRYFENLLRELKVEYKIILKVVKD